MYVVSATAAVGLLQPSAQERNVTNAIELRDAILARDVSVRLQGRIMLGELMVDPGQATLLPSLGDAGYRITLWWTRTPFSMPSARHATSLCTMVLSCGCRACTLLTARQVRRADACGKEAQRPD